MPDFWPPPSPCYTPYILIPLPYEYVRMSLAPRIIEGPYGLMLYLLNHLENCLTFDVYNKLFPPHVDPISCQASRDQRMSFPQVILQVQSI